MGYAEAMGLLFLAAVLEAGGDGLMRAGMQTSTHSLRPLFLLAGCLVLTAYGYTVNAPHWDFGRLLGVYVACFFVVSQAVAWLGFGQKPTTGILCGGVLIVAGGLIVSLIK
jgi:drug/metabolite transporter superfamily protein YnfA